MKKTEHISVNGQAINVEEMPKSIRDNVNLFDKMNEKLEAINLEQSILLIAAKSMQQKILNDINEYLKLDKENKEEENINE